MRFDPQSNFIADRPTAHAVVAGQGSGTLFPATMLLILVAAVGGFGAWMWSAGVFDPATAFGASPAESMQVAVPVAVSVPASAPAPVASAVLERDEQSDIGTADAHEDDRALLSSRRAHERGRKLMGSGHHSEAIPHLVAAVQLDPGFADGHYSLGLALVQSGRLEAARKEAKVLDDLNPSLANLLHNLTRSSR